MQNRNLPFPSKISPPWRAKPVYKCEVDLDPYHFGSGSFLVETDPNTTPDLLTRTIWIYLMKFLKLLKNTTLVSTATRSSINASDVGTGPTKMSL